MSEPELWAARDWHGELHQFAGEPFPEEGLRSDQTVFVQGDEDGDEYFGELDPSLLPDLKPGEKCRVKIERCE
jgi:hypothetical protein